MSVGYHYNLIYKDLDQTLKAFKWNSIQSKMAFKAALACVTAIVLANFIKLPHPYWSAITTLVIMRPSAGASFEKGWMRAAGCIIGCQLLCLYFVGYCIQNPLFFSIFIFIGICLAFYLGIKTKYGYFWSYMTANMALIAMIIQSNPYDNFPLHIVFYRSAEISLGVLVSWFYNIILFPRYAGDELTVKTSVLVRNTNFLLKEIIGQYTSGKIDYAIILKINKQELQPLLKDCYILLKTSANEKKLLVVDDQKFKRIFNVIEHRVDQMLYTFRLFDELANSEIGTKYSLYFDEIKISLKKIVSSDFYNSKIILVEYKKIKNIITKLNKKLQNKKEIEERKKYSINSIMLFFELIYTTESFVDDMIRLFLDDKSPKEINKLDDLEKKSFDSDFIIFSFFKKYFPLYVPALKNAVKGGIAIVVTFWICLWLNIPGGIGNMSIAIIAVFAPQMDSMATKHKGLLRLIGCLIGASFGLLILSFNIESFLILCLFIFITVFCFCIIWSGKPGVAYLGLQAGIPFLLCVGSFAPTLEIDAVVERLAGIFLAISMMWLINFVLWPGNLYKKLKLKIDNLKDTFIKYIESDYFLSEKEKITKDYVNVVSFLRVQTIALIQVLDVQQDMPMEDVKDIKEWITNIEKIIKKFNYLNTLDKSVLIFLDYKHTKLRIQIQKLVRIILNGNGKHHLKVLSLLKIMDEYMDATLIKLREDNKFKEKSIYFKKEFSLFITLYRHLIQDLQILSQIKINYKLLENNE